MKRFFFFFFFNCFLVKDPFTEQDPTPASCRKEMVNVYISLGMLLMRTLKTGKKLLCSSENDAMQWNFCELIKILCATNNSWFEEGDFL